MNANGWKKVFGFTLSQFIKSKSFIISTIVIAVLVAAVCVLTNILPLAMSEEAAGFGEVGGGDGDALYEKIYVIDDTGLISNEILAVTGLNAELTTKTASEISDEIKDSDRAYALVVFSGKRQENILTNCLIKTVYSPGGKKGSETLSIIMRELIRQANAQSLGIPAESFALSQIIVNTRILKAGEEELNEAEGLIRYILPVAVALVLFILIFAYGQIVAQSIATEKTSRVMELLLTSVRPLAVVIGKVLAMGVVSFAQFLLIVGVGVLSMTLSAPFGIIGRIAPILSDPSVIAGSADAAQSLGVSAGEFDIAQAVSKLSAGITPINIILVVIIFLLGFLFFALIAALIGASVSRMEDLQSAMQPYSILGVVGVYLAFFPLIFNADALAAGGNVSNPVQIFSYYFPISSPFALPSAVLLGNLDTTQSVIATLILAAFNVIVAILVGKVYEAIILHNGNRLKISDIVKMAKRK